MDQNNMGQQENIGGQPAGQTQNPYMAPLQPQPEYQPPAGSDDVSMGEWMWTTLLLAIPVVNLILLLVWAFGGNAKPSKENYCKAVLLWSLISVCLAIIVLILAVVLGVGMFTSYFLVI